MNVRKTRSLRVELTLCVKIYPVAMNANVRVASMEIPISDVRNAIVPNVSVRLRINSSAVTAFWRDVLKENAALKELNVFPSLEGSVIARVPRVSEPKWMALAWILTSVRKIKMLAATGQFVRINLEVTSVVVLWATLAIPTKVNVFRVK